MPNILSVKKVKRRCAPDAVEHEAEKPSELWVRLVKALTREGEIVFDPFCGRARWVKEVLSMNRHVIAVDIDGKWLDRIAQEDFGYRFDLAQVN
jgi:DNA modification methylase